MCDYVTIITEGNNRKGQVTNMIEKVFYFKNSNYIPVAMELISRTIPCFLERELIEMDYSAITVKVFEDDLNFVNGVFSILFE